MSKQHEVANWTNEKLARKYEEAQDVVGRTLTGDSTISYVMALQDLQMVADEIRLRADLAFDAEMDREAQSYLSPLREYKSVLRVWVSSDARFEDVDQELFEAALVVVNDELAEDHLANWLSRTDEPGDYRCCIYDVDGGELFGVADLDGHAGSGS